MVSIPLHSLTDLITNSSTVIYTYSEASEQALKNMVNEFLKVLGSDKTCDEVFKLTVTLEDSWSLGGYFEDLEPEDLPKDLLNEDDEIDWEKVELIFNSVKQGYLTKPEWMSDAEKHVDYYSYTPTTILNIVPLSPEYAKLAELIEKFLYSPSHEATRDG